MNIQKIFEALDEDEMNSGLGIITAELENQGYTVKINDQDVTSDQFFEGELDELEMGSTKFNLTLFKNAAVEQKFSVEFTEFHDVVLRRCN